MGSLYFLLVFCICSGFTVKISEIFQTTGIMTAGVGETVTLHCSCPNDAVTFLAWYQQSLNGKPHLISNWMKLSEKADISPLYKTRFHVETHTEESSNTLIITNLELSDSGTYYCGTLAFSGIEFGQGVFLHVKTSLSDTQLFIHQPAMEKLQLRDSVNLSCTVYAEQCAGWQSLYWFRDGGSQPSVIYPGEEHCTSFSNQKTLRKNCTLNLQLKSVNSSDEGTYHCVLASCGRVVFGAGTKVQIVGPTTGPPLLVYCLSVALAVSIIGLLVLSFSMYKLKAKLCSVCEETASPLGFSAGYNPASHDETSVHYAALSLRRSDVPQQQDTETVCIYSSVKSRNM